jgi:adenylate cyclase class IV
MIEVEFRALLDKEHHDQLMALLLKNAEDLGADDKEITYFLFPDKLLKVVNGISNASAKISLKLKRFGQGPDAEEHEVEINPAEVPKAISLLDAFGFKNHSSDFNKRHNFRYKGVEIALKYSDEVEWGHHLEMEILIDDPLAKSPAEAKIKSLADELGVKLMSESDLVALEQKIIKSKNVKEN